MDLGAPISGGGTGGQIGQRNTVPSDGFDQGVHGAGIGLSGGAAAHTAQNTQSGMMAAEQGQEYSSRTTPIADKYMGRTGGAGDRLENSLDNYDESRSSTTGTTGHHHHHHHHHQRQEEGEAVSGQYAGTEAGDALTGHAQKTGAGVGPLGENLGSGRAGVGAGDNYSSSGAGVGTGFAAGAGLGAAGGLAESDYERYGQEAGITRGPGAQKTVAGSGAVAGQQGEALGVGGGHGGQLPGQNYSSGQYSTTDYSSGNQGTGYDTGAVAASAGLGAAGMTSGRDQGGRDQGDSGGGNAGGDSGNQGDKQGGDRGGRQGHYGAVSDDANRGAPLSKAEDIDSGGPHSLVFQESTGRYVHRRDL